VPDHTPGDCNYNGIVDSADYVAWLKFNGSLAGYQLWRQNFAESGGIGSESLAPEPSLLTLIAAAWAAAGAAMRRVRPIPAPLRAPATPLRARPIRK
jgi:hypothetical protein